VRQDERLRMVSNDLWQRAKRRQAEQAEQDERIGERIKAGTSKGVREERRRRSEVLGLRAPALRPLRLQLRDRRPRYLQVLWAHQRWPSAMCQRRAPAARVGGRELRSRHQAGPPVTGGDC
jgi:hypothetical protein